MADRPRIDAVTPVMAVPDFDEGLRFFRDLLGFEVGFENGGYAWLKRDGAAVRIMDHTITEGAEPGNGRFGIYFDVTGVDAIAADIMTRLPDGWAHLRTHGPEDKPYGQREFCIEAPDGNLVVFGEEVSDPHDAG